MSRTHMFQPKRHLRNKPSQPKSNSDERVRLWLDGIRTFTGVAGALALFVLLQHPDSLLNRTQTNEAIARERAKLTLQVLKDFEGEKQQEALLIIAAAYGSKAQWVDGLAKVVKIQADIRKQAEALRAAEKEVSNALDTVNAEARAGCPRPYKYCAGPRTEIASQNYYRQTERAEEIRDKLRKSTEELRDALSKAELHYEFGMRDG